MKFTFSIEVSWFERSASIFRTTLAMTVVPMLLEIILLTMQPLGFLMMQLLLFGIGAALQKSYGRPEPSIEVGGRHISNYYQTHSTVLITFPTKVDMHTDCVKLVGVELLGLQRSASKRDI